MVLTPAIIADIDDPPDIADMAEADWKIVCKTVAAMTTPHGHELINHPDFFAIAAVLVNDGEG